MAEADQLFQKFQSTANSLGVAEVNLDSILQSICQKKWEKEVVETKGKPHAIEWVFSQAQDLYFVKPDKKRIDCEFDQDAEDEPVAGRHDWYQSDKARVKIKYRQMPEVSRASGSSLNRSVRRLNSLASGTRFALQPKKKQPIKQPSTKALKIKAQTMKFDELSDEYLRLKPQTSEQSEQKNNGARNSPTRPKIISVNKLQSIASTRQPQKEPISAMIKQGASVLGPVQQESHLSATALNTNNADDDRMSSASPKSMARRSFTRTQTMMVASYRRSKNQNEDDSDGSNVSITKRKRKLSKQNGGSRVYSPKGKKVVIMQPKPIPIPKTEAELKEIAEYEAFYAKTKDFRAQLQVKQLINQRKENQLAQRMGKSDYDPLYPFENTQEMAIKPINVERLTEIPIQGVKAVIQRSLHRIPMKTRVKPDLQASSYDNNSQRSKLEKYSSQNVGDTHRSSDRSIMVINENTKLLDVLADEFDSHGIVSGRDSRGYKEINGLATKGNGGRGGNSSRFASNNQDDGNDDYRGSLSAIKTIKIQPGVLLKEFNEEKSSKFADSVDFQKVTGGDFKAIDHIKGTVAPRMTTKQYSELSGVRQYGHLAKSQSGKATKQSPTQSLHMKVMDMNIPQEVTEQASLMTTKQESRLFPKTKKTFGLDKNCHGKVVVNSWVQNERQRPGTSLEKRMYLRSVFQDNEEENNVYSAGSTMRATTTLFDPKVNVNASYNSTTSQSYNPMEHKYARVLDLQLNAKVKQLGQKVRESNEFELDLVNRMAGGVDIIYENMPKSRASAVSQSRIDKRSMTTQATSHRTTRLLSSSKTARAGNRVIGSAMRHSSNFQGESPPRIVGVKSKLQGKSELRYQSAEGGQRQKTTYTLPQSSLFSSRAHNEHKNIMIRGKNV